MRRQYLELDHPLACIWVFCSICIQRFRATNYWKRSWLPWMRFFRASSSVVRQMPG
jgi:hypothetical protein